MRPSHPVRHLTASTKWSLCSWWAAMRTTPSSTRDRPLRTPKLNGELVRTLTVRRRRERSGRRRPRSLERSHHPSVDGLGDTKGPRDRSPAARRSLSTRRRPYPSAPWPCAAPPRRSISDHVAASSTTPSGLLLGPLTVVDPSHGAPWAEARAVLDVPSPGGIDGQHRHGVRSARSRRRQLARQAPPRSASS